MPSVEFTAKWVNAVRSPETGQIDYFDNKGIGPGRTFGLRVSYGGRKSWFVMYRVDGRLRRLTLGTYPPMGLAAAREAADAKVPGLRDGDDPAADRKARKRAPTFEELANEYLEKYAKREKQTWQRDKELLERDVLPAWCDRKACAISRADVYELIERIADRGAPIAANRTLQTVCKAFNWALDREDPRKPTYFIEYNPASRVRKFRENARDRVLSNQEIRQIWKNIARTGMTAPLRVALKLVLVTAQRKGEIIGIHKGELDLRSSWWTIPAERTKNRSGIAHRVYLTPLARGLIEEAMALSESSPFLFPSPRASKPIIASAVDHAVRRNRTLFGVVHWTPHDLRRTAASNMTASGISRFIVQKVLNHKDKGVTAIYDRYSYDAEKREALEVWARELTGIVEGVSVEP